MKKTIISFLFLLVCGMAHSQVLAKGPEESYNADSIRAILDKSPYFTLFKDNYFIGGIPVLVPAQPESNNVPSRGINKEICFITLLLFYYSPQQQKLTLLSDLFFLHRVVRRLLYFPEKKTS